MELLLKQDIPMKPPHTAVVIASYNCTAACENCCFDSHPGIQKRLTFEEITNFIDEICKFSSIKLLVFTGGECFLLGNDLDKAIEYANKKNIRTRCITNGYWAKTEKSAMDRLRNIKEAGLKEIFFSTGDFHQKFVSEMNIINGVITALSMKIQTGVIVELQKERRVMAKNLLRNPRLSKILSVDSNKKLFQIRESPWMPMSLDKEVTQNRGNYANIFNIDRKKGCPGIFNEVVISPEKKIGVCCGLTRELIPELHLGKLRTSLTEEYYKSAQDFLKIWISVEGPEKILAWLATKDPSIEWEYKYAHRCHACYAIYNNKKVQTIIKKYYHQKVNEVLNLYFQKNDLEPIPKLSFCR